MRARVSVMVLLLLMWSVACGGSRSSGVEPKPPEVRYLPSLPRPCISQPPPPEPSPPTCMLTPTSTCSADERDEYVSSLLDWGVRLRTYAALWWRVCGKGDPE